MMNPEKILGNENEKPLDNIPADGGFVGIFRTIACVGDSLASGEFELTSTVTGEKMYLDRYDYSWGQYIARMAGVKVYNFSCGGMTAKVYNESFANMNGYWNKEYAANAYIIALGVNDLLNRGWEIGDTSDIDLEDYNNNKDTFAGQFGKVIQRYKEIQPEAKFFLVTIPHSGRREECEAKAEEHRLLMYKMAELFDGTYVVDLREYGMDLTDLRPGLYLNGHLNPAGYLVVAKMIIGCMDYTIRHNLPDFKYVGVMGIDCTEKR